MVAKWGRYGRASSCIQVSASPSRFFPLEAGMGLGQSYLAISHTFSMLVSESCMQLQPTEGPRPKKVKIFCLPSLSVERSPDASQWHLGLLLGWGSRGMARQVIFQGLDSAEHKAHNWIISLASPKLRAGHFSPGKVFCCGVQAEKYSKAHAGENTQKPTGEILQKKYSKAHRGRRPAITTSCKVKVAQSTSTCRPRCLIWKYLTINIIYLTHDFLVKLTRGSSSTFPSYVHLNLSFGGCFGNIIGFHLFGITPFGDYPFKKLCASVQFPFFL